MKDYVKQQMNAMRTRSGTVTIDCKLTAFLYDLMRDHLSAGAMEKLLAQSVDGPVIYTNGWLAQYAADIAARLKETDTVK